MSVTVVPYNPWKEQLAVGILQHLWDRQNEANADKKLNAYLGELSNPNRIQAQIPDGLNSLAPGTNTSSQVTAPGLLDSITGSNPQVASPAPKVTTMGDALQLLATPRFSGLNTERVLQNIAPFLQEQAAQEQARKAALAQQQRQQFWAQALQNMPANVNDWLGLSMGAMAGGNMSDEQFKALANVLDQMGGRSLQTDAGNRGILSSYSPLTGAFGNQQVIPYGINPNTQLQADVSRENNIRSNAQSDINSRRSAGVGYANVSLGRDRLNHDIANDEVNNAYKAQQNEWALKRLQQDMEDKEFSNWLSLYNAFWGNNNNNGDYYTEDNIDAALNTAPPQTATPTQFFGGGTEAKNDKEILENKMLERAGVRKRVKVPRKN